MSDNFPNDGTASETATSDDATVDPSQILGDEPTPVTPASVRLRRSRDHRVIAGVCGGLAERFDVNDNLVRVVFVVLTLFYGLGAAIYLVLWAVVRSNDSGGTVATPRPVTRPVTPVSTSRRLTIAVAAGVIVLAGFIINVAHPFRLLGPGLALAWIIFLVVLAIIAVGTPARRVTPRRIVGVMFLVGTSVIVVILGTAWSLLESTGVSLAGGNGEHIWQPTSLGQVMHSYRTEFGVGTLDVSAVEFPASGFVIHASVAAGELRIVVPADAVVSLSTNVGIGTVVEDSPVSIPGISTAAFTSLPVGRSVAQTGRSPHLMIDARVGWGQIDLMRVAPGGS